MEPLEQIRYWFAALRVELVGAADYAALLPLLPVGSRRRIPEGARSVTVALFPYYIGALPQPRNLARYTVSLDYHRICGDYLEQVTALCREKWPQEQFQWFVDASPIREVEAAVQAGLGIRGENGQLLTDAYGSYVFIGEIVSTLLLPAGTPIGRHCLECGRCRSACPTGALTANGVDKSLCRSQITQKKGVLTPEEEASIRAGGLAWGCDVCTDVCPYNQAPRLTPLSPFYAGLCPMLTANNVKEAMEDRALNYRGEKPLLRNLLLLERGAEHRQ